MGSGNKHGCMSWSSVMSLETNFISEALCELILKKENFFSLIG